MEEQTDPVSPDLSHQAVEDWLKAAEMLRDFFAVDFEQSPDSSAARQLIKEVLCAENRVRAINGYPPRMFRTDGPG